MKKHHHDHKVGAGAHAALVAGVTVAGRPDRRQGRWRVLRSWTSLLAWHFSRDLTEHRRIWRKRKNDQSEYTNRSGPLHSNCNQRQCRCMLKNHGWDILKIKIAVTPSVSSPQTAELHPRTALFTLQRSQSASLQRRTAHLHPRRNSSLTTGVTPAGTFSLKSH